jgi:hypothetical protein
MLKGRDLMPILERFLGPKMKASVAQDARVQVRTPDGRYFDVQSINARHRTHGACKMFPGTSILQLVACGFKLDEACCLSLEACGLYLDCL